ncbi:MAG: NADP-dependent phosphogluconate dehydrogenase [Proteobacteria bacterium]|nr:NADP-dependent phosphogluconate dehydrogenase [Pseudomonadota bacterium]MBI3498561.1 NADP-dependent phosphogluconate dehydrogenase [Pseudomonadota bacterium]
MRAIGLIGLGVMGRNLALNLAGHGIAVHAYDLDEAARTGLAGLESIRLSRSPAALLAGLERPRAILVMVNAGAATDRAIESLEPGLSAGDILADGGNAHYTDTIGRARALGKSGVRFLGLGVSGGAEGARLGPALMAGGDAGAFRELEPILDAIAAKAGGRACLGYFGGDGAGHFVKMVHNAIEYAVMAAIAEAWFALRHLAGLAHGEAAEAIAGWNRGEAQSYLLEITADVLGRIDGASGQPLVEMVLDRAEQKGTGAWAVEASLALGVAAPSLAEAVFARTLSSAKEERVAAELRLGSPLHVDPSQRDALRRQLPRALFAATLACYAQGFQLLAAGSSQHGWNIDPAAVAEVWRGGCILRAALLDPIAAAFRGAPGLANLMLDSALAAAMAEREADWRAMVAAALVGGAPVPVLASALAYAQGYRTKRGAAALIQAQRDRFGGHGFQRIDRPGNHHGPWSGPE